MALFSENFWPSLAVIIGRQYMVQTKAHKHKRAHVIRTRRLHARLHVFVPAYQWHGYSDIVMLVDDAPLKNPDASRPFCSREPPVATHQNVDFAAMPR
jgi:hypothetical protein